MNWTYFILGFASCLTLVALFILWVNRSNMVTPLVITDAKSLQSIIGRLFQHGRDGEILYILDRISQFSIRIVKIKRKTKEDTLKVEIRATDKNADCYPIAREVLTNESIEFEEKLTPKLKRGSRIFLKYEDGGIFTVSAISQAVGKIMRTINKNQNIDVLVSDRSPHFWKKIKLNDITSH